MITNPVLEVRFRQPKHLVNKIQDFQFSSQYLLIVVFHLNFSLSKYQDIFN